MELYPIYFITFGKFSSILAYKQNNVDERFHNKRNSGVKKF